MAEVDPFGAAAALGPVPGGPAVGNRVVSGGSSEEDPAAAFLAQQESEIAGIENYEVFSILDSGNGPTSLQGEPPGGPDAINGVMNGEYDQESNGPTDSYAAISQVDPLQSEPEPMKCLEVLDASSQKQEAKWKEKVIKELEEWYARQGKQLQKNKSNRAAEEAFANGVEETSPGTEEERRVWLSDVSRMLSVLISLKQAPLVH